jgi:Asp-tRNA(Asn)/Glu-tRNA(Gln) amidotransferase A subunit family amidase
MTIDTLHRIAAADGALGAFVCTLDAATAAGHAARLAGPLAGLAVAVKDVFDTADLATAYGSPIYAGHRPRADAAIVSLLRRTGALVIGKAVTTEFAYLEPAATRNPKAPGHTPGGSSAGSAAAVAAGLVPLAVGTQTGGSVIRPASYCGVVGYKPSFGWLPTEGLKCFSRSLDTVGLFTPGVAEMAHCAAALTGRPLAAELGRWSVGVPDAYPWPAPSANAERAIARAAQALRGAGVEVRGCTLPPGAGAAFEAHAAIQGYEAWRSLAWEFDHHAELLSPLLRAYLHEAGSITPADYDAAQHSAAAARAEAAAWFGGFDILLTPSAPDEPPLGYASTGASTFNRLWTLLGLPCINVPGLHGDTGCPMGVQLIAPFGADARLLQAAAVLERALRDGA